ncbi:capsule biosynthesis protein [uncultured Litoreibacter sp.]|uniref:capsule biosynthesis protein n=1 Tax=uncultured Litoreibacter sp. TaxID=1392394 RepID=UPI002617BA0F|nr:capsule biosynthesis protein [uncultured Litoreibacter sp.]
MSTKPKARKFRIRRSEPARPSAAAALQEVLTPAAGAADTPPANVAPQPKPKTAPKSAPDAQMFAPSKDDGFGTIDAKTPPATPSEGTATPAKPATPAQAIDAIRREGLTGRQLRMARRVAQKQGLSPTSDYDAVRLLREQGIDPFKRANMLELVVSDAKGEQAKGTQPLAQIATTPGTQISPVVQKPSLPSTQVITEPERARDVMDIQRDIARRRRKRATLLFSRLLFFVMLPTALAGYYYFAVATPMYATNSEFVIQSADGGAAGGAGGLLSGSPLANSSDSIAVQGYLQSRDAMLRLNEDEGFRDHFSQDFIDPIQRLDPDATQEAAYKAFKKSVKIGYDPTEGIIKMEVAAATPEASAQFSKQLIGYAEQQVDQLTARKRDDQMAGADESRKEAEQKMIDAQDRIVEIQEKLGVLSPESEAQAIFAQISQLDGELLNERIALAQFLRNPRPNSAKVDASRNTIEQLELLIAEKRALLTESSSDAESLARVSGELLVAQADLQVRQELLGQAEAAFEAARLEANRQVRYLSVSVSPVAPDEATYPRAFENTLLAFLIFSGIYLMVSLTSSILREQV